MSDEELAAIEAAMTDWGTSPNQRKLLAEVKRLRAANAELVALLRESRRDYVRDKGKDGDLTTRIDAALAKGGHK